MNERLNLHILAAPQIVGFWLLRSSRPHPVLAITRITPPTTWLAAVLGGLIGTLGIGLSLYGAYWNNFALCYGGAQMAAVGFAIAGLCMPISDNVSKTVKFIYGILSACVGLLRSIITMTGGIMVGTKLKSVGFVAIVATYTYSMSIVGILLGMEIEEALLP